jgi:hypothetical protein
MAQAQQWCRAQRQGTARSKSHGVVLVPVNEHGGTERHDCFSCPISARPPPPPPRPQLRSCPVSLDTGTRSIGAGAGCRALCHGLCKRRSTCSCRHYHSAPYSIRFRIRNRLGQRHSHQSTTLTSLFLYKYLLESYICTFL